MVMNLGDVLWCSQARQVVRAVISFGVTAKGKDSLGLMGSSFLALLMNLKFWFKSVEPSSRAMMSEMRSLLPYDLNSVDLQFDGPDIHLSGRMICQFVSIYCMLQLRLRNEIADSPVVFSSLKIKGRRWFSPALTPEYRTSALPFKDSCRILELSSPSRYKKLDNG